MLLFKRNTLRYIGLRCDACADARDAGPPEVLQALGWQVHSEEVPGLQDLCPQCNPAHPVGNRAGRRDSDRVAGLDFEHALGAVRQFLGRQVSILVTPVAAAVDRPAYLAQFRGILTQGEPERVVAMHGGDDAFFFSLDDDASAGLYMEAAQFEGAQWLGENAKSLVVTMAGVNFSVVRT